MSVWQVESVELIANPRGAAGSKMLRILFEKMTGVQCGVIVGADMSIAPNEGVDSVMSCLQDMASDLQTLTDAIENGNGG